MKSEVKLFEQQKVRTHWDEKEEKWFFSISDVIAILTQSVDPLAYWSNCSVSATSVIRILPSAACIFKP